MSEKTCVDACCCRTENTGTSCRCCGGCGIANLPLSAEERQLLERFAVIPFMPVLWNSADQSILLLESDIPAGKAEPALSLLLRRRYVDIDLQKPLKNYPYGSHPECQAGSAALTARGQDALDELEYGGSYAQ